MSKVISLATAIAAIPDGSSLALGGNTMHRSHSAAVHELVRQDKRELTLIKTAGAYDIDVLCGAGCVARLVVAYVGFENLRGMALRFRAAIETGQVHLEEHTCASVIAGLRAVVQGVPFMPLAGMTGTDLVPGRFHAVANPYGEGEVITIPAIQPDWAIVHVQEADSEGNARILGTTFEDALIARAARHVLVTCERLVSGAELARQPELTTIAGFQVEAVVEAPGGAWPASCAGYYDIDEAAIARYYELAAQATPERIRAF
ncbi:MAG TPA: CoA-transferase, partial [Chloroflexota bacterium]|nr:CoA-transferase [Chloroflexota bacterium]